MDISAYIKNEKERPLDVIKPDGGFFGIFRTVACVGDSLASGEFRRLTRMGAMTTMTATIIPGDSLWQGRPGARCIIFRGAE